MTDTQSQYSAFSPADYPAYQFQPDGTPVRVVPCTRGRFAGWTGPITPFVNKYGRELFGITRKDGVQRGISRSTIIKALSGDTVTPPGAHESVAIDPFEDPDGLFPRRSLSPSFPDYVADILGRVWRFQSPSRGRYAVPRYVKPVTPSGRLRRDGERAARYLVLDSIAGTRDYVKPQQAVAAAGWTDPDEIAVARAIADSARVDYDR